MIILSAWRELLVHCYGNIDVTTFLEKFGLKMLILESTSPPSRNNAPENKQRYREKFLTTKTSSAILLIIEKKNGNKPYINYKNGLVNKYISI